MLLLLITLALEPELGLGIHLGETRTKDYFGTIYGLTVAGYHRRDELTYGPYLEAEYKRNQAYGNRYLENPNLFTELKAVGFGLNIGYELYELVTVRSGAGYYWAWFGYDDAGPNGTVVQSVTRKGSWGAHMAWELNRSYRRLRYGARLRFLLMPFEGNRDYYGGYYEDSRDPFDHFSLNSVNLGFLIGYGGIL